MITVITRWLSAGLSVGMQTVRFCWAAINPAALKRMPAAGPLISMPLGSSPLRTTSFAASELSQPWTIQRAQSALLVQLTPSALPHTVTGALRRIASDRASCRAAVNSPAVLLRRLEFISVTMAGAAAAASSATTAMVTISSIRLKPGARARRVRALGQVWRGTGIPLPFWMIHRSLPAPPDASASRTNGVIRGPNGSLRAKAGNGLRHHVPTTPSSPDMSPPSPPAYLSPLDILWQARTLVWMLLAGEALAAVLAIAPGVEGDRLTYFGMASLAIQWIALTALALLYALRRWLVRVAPPAVAQVGLGALLLSTWIMLGLGWLALRDVFPAPDGGWPGFALRVTAIASIMGLLGLGAFQAQWRARRLAVNAEQAKLQALQARIQPHFLFNTLNTGISLLHARPDTAEQLLLDLSDLFRAALSQRDTLPLAEDLSLARRYMEIEQLRLGGRLRLTWQLPDALPDVPVPILSVQPLAENAIRHGIEPSTDGGEVHIRVALAADSLQVTVANTLPAPHAPAALGHQVGLSSVRARIHAATRGRGRVDTHVADGRYVATIHLPLSAGG